MGYNCARKRPFRLRFEASRVVSSLPSVLRHQAHQGTNGGPRNVFWISLLFQGLDPRRSNFARLARWVPSDTWPDQRLQSSSQPSTASASPASVRSVASDDSGPGPHRSRGIKVGMYLDQQLTHVDVLLCRRPSKVRPARLGHGDERGVAIFHE